METPVGPGNPTQGVWPDAAQELLFHAALQPPHEAVIAWNQWAASNDLDRLDHASIQLLPQVSRNLQDVSADVHGDLGRIKGLYRQSWYRNQIELRAAALALHTLAEARVPALLLGSAALVLRYDPSRALRPIDDLGVLVAPSDLPRACAALAGIGWQPLPQRPPEARPRFMRLANDRGATLDLHTRLFAEELAPATADGVWERAEVVVWQDIRMSLLAPVHQLLYACVHGMRWRTVPEVRWLADVALIVEGDADHLDARGLVHAAELHHVSLPLRLSLEYLRDRLAVRVPCAWIEQLAQVRASARERLELHLLCRPPGGILGGLPARGSRWLRLTHNHPWPQRLLGFPSFLAEDLGCDGVVELVRFAAVEAVRRMAIAAKGARE